MIRKLIPLLMLLLSGTHARAVDAPLEYQVKAVCVLNTIRFVSWPPAAFSGADAPLVIGILGENPFGSLLQDVVKGETVQQRRIVVQRVSLKEAASVHVLFICHSESGHLEDIVRTLASASVLTISEIDRFTQDGGMVGLTLVGGKIRFAVNADVARRAQLKIDSQFLLLARSAK